LPHRTPPAELGVKQQRQTEPTTPGEFIFCSPTGGAWPCQGATQKTLSADAGKKIDLSGSSQRGVSGSSVNTAVKDALSKITPSFKVLPGEKEIPNSPPLAVVEFDFDSSKLRADAKLKLIDALPLLKGKKLEIHGYTDNVGGKPYNNKLGQKRADAVLLFIKSGEVADSMSAYGHGLCCYKVPNDTEEQRATNRRVEVYATN